VLGEKISKKKKKRSVHKQNTNLNPSRAGSTFFILGFFCPAPAGAAAPPLPRALPPPLPLPPPPPELGCAVVGAGAAAVVAPPRFALVVLGDGLPRLLFCPLPPRPALLAGDGAEVVLVVVVLPGCWLSPFFFCVGVFAVGFAFFFCPGGAFFCLAGGVLEDLGCCGFVADGRDGKSLLLKKRE